MGKKAFTLISVFLFFTSGFLSSQDLAKLSKAERERRARLDTKSSRVVTNQDLLRLKARPVVDIPAQPSEQEAATLESQVEEQIPDYQKTPQTDEQETLEKFGTGILPTSKFVQNPEEAIGVPDGKFAEIGYWGWLDVEMEVFNGEGNDIAVYASRSFEGIQDSRMMHYLVFVQRDSAWVCIGIGGGLTGPEKFDLGDIPQVDKIRIMYRNRHELNQIQPNLGQTNRISSYSMRIDSVEALHKNF
jgi:hypothetical protein